MTKAKNVNKGTHTLADDRKYSRKGRRMSKTEGLWLESFITVGIEKSFGIFFVEFLDEYGSKASVASLIAGVEHGGFSIASFLVLSIGRKMFSVRVAVLLGAMSMSLGFIITSFATGVNLVIFSYGVLFGLGIGMSHGPAMTTVGMYFDKRRGCANGIAMSGSSLGSLIFPLLIRQIIDEYTLNGSFIIVTGLTIQVFIAGSLFRPIEFYTKSYKHKFADNDKLEGEKENASTKSYLDHTDIVNNDDLHVVNKKCSADDNDVIKPKTNASDARDIKDSKPIFETSDEKTTTFLKAENSKCSCSKYCGCFGHRCDYGHNSENNIRNLVDCSILKNKMFLFYLGTITLMTLPATIPTVFIAGHARDIEVGQQEISFLVSAIGIGDFLGRICFGALGDISCIRRSRLVAFNHLVVGIAFNIPQIYSNFWSLLVVAAIYGLFATSTMSVIAVLLVDFCGIEILSNGLGITLLLHGLLIMVGLPVFGVLRDITGSYVSTFHILGVLAILSAIWLLLEPFASSKFQPKGRDHSEIVLHETEPLSE